MTSAETLQNIRQKARLGLWKILQANDLRTYCTVRSILKKIVYFVSWKIPGFEVGNLAGLYCRFGRTLVIVGYYIFKITGYLFSKQNC